MSKNMRKTMWEAISNSPFLMISLNHTLQHSEPMTAQLDKDADSEFWFYTTKTNRIAEGGPAKASFMSKDHKVFASIRGTLVPETDKAIIDKYWSNMAASWYDEGRDDPALLMMRFELDDAEVWVSDPSIKGLYKLFTDGKVEPEMMGEHKKLGL
ncbi:MAG TPA: general stress protein [Methylophaga aminisulfidivorans]|nr:general stress protein [Methylophaga aminisulfidivorans]